MATDGARLAIRLLQDAAERGDLDPWDVDVIAVVDGFLDQLRARIAARTHRDTQRRKTALESSALPAKRSTRNAKISRLSKGAQSIAYDEED